MVRTAAKVDFTVPRTCRWSVPDLPLLWERGLPTDHRRTVDFSLRQRDSERKTKVYATRMMRLTIARRALRLEFELTVNAKHFVRGAKASHLFVRAGCARTARRDAGAPSEVHNMLHNLFNSLHSFSPNSGET